MLQIVRPAIAVLIALSSGIIQAATPGLPFTEDFTSTTLQDSPQTNARWDTDQEQLTLSRWQRRFGALQSATSTSRDITADVNFTRAIELGDVNGDGYLDVVVGNADTTNRLYLNNGSADPFNGVTGMNIGEDINNTTAITLGDMDGDGDLDVIAGNGSIAGEANRLYLNNGSAAPFNGVIGTNIGADRNNTTAIAVGDVDSDGDLDVIVGNNPERNQLYLNNGSTDPFNDVTGTSISADINATFAIALGDVDGDGDLDVFAGNGGVFGEANRLYLNNGGADPFNGVTGTDITEEANDTRAIALGDVDGDGNLDIITGNTLNLNGSVANRLYLNNGSAAPFNGVTGTNISATDSNSTFAIALGDVDGDGDLDVIAGTLLGTSRLRLTLNNGGANPFNSAISTSISADINSVFAIALGDMDGDGDLDLIEGNGRLGVEEDSSISGEINRLHLNNGNANPFNGVTSMDITADGDLTRAIAVGDVDGDGDLDVVAGNRASQPNLLYLNNGSADPFNDVTGVNITVDRNNTDAIALGDVDRDGDLDVIAGNRFGTNRLYLNNGSADPFNGVTGVDITAERNSTRAIALGDVDGDGDLDLIEGNDAGERINRLYLNNGSAAPFNGVIGVNITADANNTQAIVLGDVDGDGDLDIVAGNALRSSNVSDRLYLNNGSADPFNGVTGTNIGAPEGISTQAIALGDVDGDGDLDVIVARSTNRLYLNNGSADPFNGVTSSNITQEINFTTAFVLVDVDVDGDLDIITGNRSERNNRLYLNNGSADPFNGVSGRNIGSSRNDTVGIAVGDVDGDGDLDVIEGNEGQTTLLTLNNGSANPFNDVSGTNIDAGTDITRAIAIGDVDGDGDLDIIAGNADTFTSASPNRLYLNNGSADPFNGVIGVNITADTDDTVSIVLSDVDSDGDLDVVAGNFLQPNRLYLNNGSADPFNGVTGVNITSDADATSAIVLGDVDSDGDLDVIVGNMGLVPNRLVLNNGSAAPFNGVTSTNLTEDLDGTYAIALGDVDDDGDLDVIAGNRGRNRLYLNNGSTDPFNGVTGTNISVDTNNTEAIALGDVDGDGDLDVFAGNGGVFGEANRLYLNNGSAAPFNGVIGVNITADTDRTAAIALGDVDADGDLDVIAGNFRQTNRLILNNGTLDPFDGVTGTNISEDIGDTFAIALGDIDGNGVLDIIAGNIFQPNRLYRRSTRFDTARNRARSVRVDTQTSNISNATLTDTQTQPVPTNTSVDYYLSNNGGAQWFITQPGRPFVFPTTGNDLRWRAELQSLSPALTPVIDQIDITSGTVANLTLNILAASISEADGLAATTATVSRNFNTSTDLVVTLISSDTSEATVPSTVTIPAGQSTSPAFAINAVNDDLLDGDQEVEIRAVVEGSIDGIANIIVRDDESDGDGDGVFDDVDNCPFISNPDQADFEGDGIGDACDPDTDGDGLPDDYELANGLDPRNSLDRDADPDNDGFTNIEEFEFGSDPQVADTDENNNGIPDAAENPTPVVVPILQLLLLDDDE